MRNRPLLDTCAMIWMAQDEVLSPAATEAIDDAFADGEGISISSITAWELGLLERRGRLPAAVPPLALFERFAALPAVRLEGLDPTILIDSSFLPGEFHNDPADRIIIATARALALTIVTRDKAILDYAKQGYVRALKC